jgi:hypothetical protein
VGNVRHIDRRRAPLSVRALILVTTLVLPVAANAEPLVVLEARGTGSTAGETIDSASRLTLERGEHLRLIAQNGNQYCLDGPYDGPAEPSFKRASSIDWFVSLLFGSSRQDRINRLTDCMR